MKVLSSEIEDKTALFGLLSGKFLFFTARLCANCATKSVFVTTLVPAKSIYSIQNTLL